MGGRRRALPRAPARRRGPGRRRLRQRHRAVPRAVRRGRRAAAAGDPLRDRHPGRGRDRRAHRTARRRRDPRALRLGALQPGARARSSSGCGGTSPTFGPQPRAAHGQQLRRLAADGRVGARPPLGEPVRPALRPRASRGTPSGPTRSRPASAAALAWPAEVVGTVTTGRRGDRHPGGHAGRRRHDRRLGRGGERRRARPWRADAHVRLDDVPRPRRHPPPRTPGFGRRAASTPGRSRAAGLATQAASPPGYATLLGEPGFDELLAEAGGAHREPGACSSLPYFAGERTPFPDPQARGGSAGRRSGTVAATSTARCSRHRLGVRHNLERWTRARSRASPSAAAPAELWAQIVSDVTGLAQEMPPVDDRRVLRRRPAAAEAAGLAEHGGRGCGPERVVSRTRRPATPTTSSTGSTASSTLRPRDPARARRGSAAARDEAGHPGTADRSRGSRDRPQPWRREAHAAIQRSRHAFGQPRAAVGRADALDQPGKLHRRKGQGRHGDRGHGRSVCRDLGRAGRSRPP